MRELYPQNWESYLPVFFIFLRLLGMFLLIPGFSHNAIPMKMKLLLSVVTALGLYPVLKPFVPAMSPDMLVMMVAVIREVVIGFVMGLAAYITFEALALGAQFVGSQMGFGASGLFDPMSQTQSSVLVALKGWIVLMIFFGLDIHHQILYLFITSFEFSHRIHVEGIGSMAAVSEFIRLSGKLFVMAIQVSAPFTFLVFALNAAIGVLSRMLPQMNIILFSFPITITLGLAGLYIVAPEYLDFIEHALNNMTGDMINLLRAV